MVLVFYAILFIIIFRILNSNLSIKSIIIIDLSIQIMMGNINENLNLILPPPDVSTLIIFINFLLFSAKNGRNYFFQSTWVDKLLFLYLLFVLLIPGLINLTLFSVPLTYKFFIPLRYWFVYRNFYCYFSENQIRQNKTNVTNLILTTLMVVGLLSAFISMSRFFNLPGGELIENLWPVYYEKKQIKMSTWGRMTGTMSDTNGAGNFFCFLTIISLFELKKINMRNIIFPFIFGVSVVLTGSFSSIAALVAILIIYFRKRIFSKNIVLIILVSLGIVYAIQKVDIFKTAINKRYETGYKSNNNKGILPSNLKGRIGYWKTFSKILYDEGRLMFGLGPGGFFNYQYGKNNVVNQNAESFYFRIINESGIFALLFVIIFFSAIFRKVINQIPKEFHYKQLFTLLLLSYLISGVANETLYYGSNASLFGIILCMIYVNTRIKVSNQVKPFMVKNQNVRYNPIN